MNDIFTPPWYLGNPMVQTFLSSSPLRKLGEDDMDRASGEIILDAGEGVRLQGFHSPVTGSPRGMAILLHGWEGSGDSAYLVNTARFLHRRGFDIFRLNLRDHGTSHHLNEGLFYGTLIDETHAAVKKAAVLSRNVPVMLIGFSMGANFALRIASLHGRDPVPGLALVVTINPPLDPYRATVNIDRIGTIRSYFLKKWKKSLKKKQELFPSLYDFRRELEMDTCMEITESLIMRLTDYGDARTYFRGYTLKEGWLDTIVVPTAIIMSRDDPFIPADDLEAAALGPGVRVLMQDRGGHCGYIDGLRLGSWYQGAALELFEDALLTGKTLEPQMNADTRR